MPGLDELEWVEFRDFTGGLWEQDNDRDCAPNGLLECTDCYPVPTGGLRAFAKFRPIRATWTTPLYDDASSHIVGIWNISGYAPGPTLWVQVVGGTAPPYSYGIYHMDATESALDGGGGDNWSQSRTRTDITSIQMALRMVPFETTAGSYLLYNHPIETTSTASTLGPGIWGTISDYTTMNKQIAELDLDQPYRGLWTHQGRLLSIASTGFQDPKWKHIVYGSAGGLNTTGGNISPLGEFPSAVKCLEPYPPSDLFWIKEGVGYGTIQGPITAPTVRQLGYTHISLRGWPVKTDMGLVMVIANEGAYVWNGEALSHISQPILGDPMGGTPYISEGEDIRDVDTATGCDLEDAPDFAGDDLTSHCSGQLGTFEHWVFFNNGYMLDMRTGAWFKQTSVDGARWWAADTDNRRMYVATNKKFQATATRIRPIPNVLFWSRMGESSWTPMDKYSFTLPLIESPGQRTNLRELEYSISTFNDSSTITVEVTAADSGSTFYGPFPLGNSRAEAVRILVAGHPTEWYKVRTTLSSNRSDDAAPTLTAMRVATQPSTRTPVNRA